MTYGNKSLQIALFPLWNSYQLPHHIDTIGNTQYTNVTDRQTGRHTYRQTDRQTDRQRSDSIGRTVLQTVAQKTTKFHLFSTNKFTTPSQRRVFPNILYIPGYCANRLR